MSSHIYSLKKIPWWSRAGYCKWLHYVLEAGITINCFIQNHRKIYMRPQWAHGYSEYQKKKEMGLLEWQGFKYLYHGTRRVWHMFCVIWYKNDFQTKGQKAEEKQKHIIVKKEERIHIPLNTRAQTCVLHQTAIWSENISLLSSRGLKRRIWLLKNALIHKTVKYFSWKHIYISVFTCSTQRKSQGSLNVALNRKLISILPAFLMFIFALACLHYDVRFVIITIILKDHRIQYFANYSVIICNRHFTHD